MGARTDLMEVAGALATEARELAEPKQVEGAPNVRMPSQALRVAELALGAKAALEAAALVDADPAPIIAALDRLHTRMGNLGVEAVLEDAGPAATIDHVSDLLEHAFREVAIGAAVQSGYVALRELLSGLYRDFKAGEGETARRIAARIEVGLDSADEAITRAKGQEAQHG